MNRRQDRGGIGDRRLGCDAEVRSGDRDLRAERSQGLVPRVVGDVRVPVEPDARLKRTLSVGRRSNACVSSTVPSVCQPPFLPVLNCHVPVPAVPLMAMPNTLVGSVSLANRPRNVLTVYAADALAFNEIGFKTGCPARSMTGAALPTTTQACSVCWLKAESAGLPASTSGVTGVAPSVWSRPDR